MSFLSLDSAEFLSAKLTKEGRKAISKGRFNIKYFQIGDSEYDYNFFGFNGILGNKSQFILKPNDDISFFKYPYKLSDEVNSTTYGEPIQFSSTDIVRNIVPPSGIIGDKKNINSIYGAYIQTDYQRLPFSKLNGTNQLVINSGTTFNNATYVTIMLNELDAIVPNEPCILNNNISFFYKVVSISGTTLTLDRNLPNYSGKTGYFHLLRNNAENEFNESLYETQYCIPKQDYTQLNPWILNNVWGEKVIGSDVNGTDASLNNYISNSLVSAKEYFGYSSDSQICVDFSGNTVDTYTSYLNDNNQIIKVLPTEQRCISIISYKNDTVINNEDIEERYEDLISIIDDKYLAYDVDNNGISDNDYFEVYIPFILYHRNINNNIGLTLKMESNTYYLVSKQNTKSKIPFRFLIDNYNNRVGKVFYTNKIIIIDDQEIVATLDYKSNRNFTLGAPSLNLINNQNYNGSVTNELTDENADKTYHITYMLVNDETNLSYNYLPCNYYSKINSSKIKSNIGIKFSPNSFKFMSNSNNDFKTKYNAKKIYILIQETELGMTPKPELWRKIDVTSQLTSNQYINPTELQQKLFIINKTDYDNSLIFDLEEYMGVNYLGDTTSNLYNNFGDEVPFVGSIKLVRAREIEKMNFLVNLPSNQFLTTQNLTYTTGSKKITEVCLLDDFKNIMVVGKFNKPIERYGTQLISLKLDF